MFLVEQKVCAAALDAELISEYEKQNLNLNTEHKKNSLSMKSNILGVGPGYCDPSLISLKMLAKITKGYEIIRFEPFEYSSYNQHCSVKSDLKRTRVVSRLSCSDEQGG